MGAPVYQNPMIDLRGNISVHGSAGAIMKITGSNGENIWSRQPVFETDFGVTIYATPIDTDTKSALFIFPLETIQMIPVRGGRFFVHDAADNFSQQPWWEGSITLRGFV